MKCGDWKGHLFVPVFYQGGLIAAIFDPGAECTSITTGCLKRLKAESKIDPSVNIWFSNADDST